MQPVLSRCGYRCDLCLAFKPNVDANPENRRALSDGWQRYYGFRIPPSRICCDGCLAEDPRLIDQSCPVRPCVIERGLEHCLQCENYVCEKLATRIVDAEDMRQRVKREISDADYQRFIRPYENRRRFRALRRCESTPDDE